MVEVFYFADRNKDGVVTVEELAVIERSMTAAFDAADKNRRRQALPQDEFVTYRMIDFDAADKNHDGVLTYEEVQAWRRAEQRLRRRPARSSRASRAICLRRGVDGRDKPGHDGNA